MAGRKPISSFWIWNTSRSTSSRPRRWNSAQEASANLGREMNLKKTGGGSDANIFFKKNIIAGVIGTGMQDIHTVRENIRVADMVKAVGLLLEIIKVNSMRKGN